MRFFSLHALRPSLLAEFQQLVFRSSYLHEKLIRVLFCFPLFSLAQAIEDKQVAEQNAERAKFVVAKAEQEKEALIIRSEGDSEAARLVSDALQKNGKGLIELRRIETAVQIAESLAGNSHVTYLPAQKAGSGGGVLLALPPTR